MNVSDREGSIHDQVLHTINRKLSSVTQGTQIVLKTYEQALADLKTWIEGNVPGGESAAALKTTLSGLSQSAAKTYLAKIYTYLAAFHNAESINVWITGFIGEAIRAYSDHMSCPQGVEERMITGLEDRRPCARFSF